MKKKVINVLLLLFLIFSFSVSSGNKVYATETATQSQLGENNQDSLFGIGLLAEILKNQVLRHGKIKNQSVFLAVLGDAGHAMLEDFSRGASEKILAQDIPLTGFAFSKT